jgi:hypothetical protein
MRTARPRSLAGRMIVISLLSFAPLSSAFAQQNPVLSEKELKLLLKTAKTPSEHRRIATYYRQEGQRSRRYPLPSFLRRCTGIGRKER